MADSESTKSGGAESNGTEPRSSEASRAFCLAIGIYLFAAGALSLWLLIALFPEHVATPGADPGVTKLQFPALSSVPFLAGELKTAQGLLVLALLAGVLGSFLHAAQSFAAYVGNRQLKVSWGWWYVLRPPIGAVLGVLFYFVARAGLFGAGSEDVSPYGVVAMGALAGWFSKQATDKLAEVFDTLFRTDKSKDYRNQLAGAPLAPMIVSVGVQALEGSDDKLLSVRGERFERDIQAFIDNEQQQLVYRSDKLVEVRVPATKISAAGAKINLVLRNPGPDHPASPPLEVRLG